MQQFDSAANDYDQQFSNSCVGKAQREQVWKYVDQFVTDHVNTILEINCGTGHDAALWKLRGKEVVGTDISSAMVSMAKTNHPTIVFNQLDLRNIASLNPQSDAIFSNFGGLNCLSPEELKSFLKDVSELQQTGNYLVITIMGKKCLWDRFYLFLKGRVRERNRRNTDDPVLVNVSDKEVPTWYYSPREVISITRSAYETVSVRPIGLFVPPSYLASAFENRKRIFHLLRWFDSILSFRMLSNYADHYLMILKRR